MYITENYHSPHQLPLPFLYHIAGGDKRKRKENPIYGVFRRGATATPRRAGCMSCISQMSKYYHFSTLKYLQNGNMLLFCNF